MSIRDATDAREGAPLPSIPPTAEEFRRWLRDALAEPADLVLASCAEGSRTVAYLSSLADKSLVQAALASLAGGNTGGGAAGPGEAFLGCCRELTEAGDVLADLLRGFTVLHWAGGRVCACDTAGGAKRKPAEPTNERTTRGPKVSFVEDLQDNLALVRQGLQDASLRIECLRLGRRTRTAVALLHLDGMADPSLIKEARRRLRRINMDGIVDSGYIEQLISDNRWSVFPLTQATERPDKVIAGLLEGRAAILAQGSPFAILVPATINELYQSPEDYYYNLWVGGFLRFFRILGNVISVALPGLYLAMVGVNPELLPIRFALTVSGSRMGVALPLLFEVLLLEAIMEVFREAVLRLPGAISQTLGIVSGVILSIAGTATGLISQATLVMVVLTTVASLSAPSMAVGLTWRILRFALILAAALFGLYGLTLAGLGVLAHAAIQNSFGTAYLAPWSPIRLREMKDTIMRRPIWTKHRSSTYRPLDAKRYEEADERDE